MLHLLNENKMLRYKLFVIPQKIKQHLENTLSNYKGDATIDGYKRLNNLVHSKELTYNEMKRIKNFFDNYNGSVDNPTYLLNGGNVMKSWVDLELQKATQAIKDFKHTQKDMGVENAFIKKHSKRRDIKTNTPTQVKFKTKNLNTNIMNNQTLKYESVIREIIKEEINKILEKNEINEAISSDFNIEEFNKLTSFKARYNYCEEKLGPPIGKGSSRVVFQLTDFQVLKLALNGKGVSQNQKERLYARDSYLCTQIFAHADDFMWLVSEAVLPAKKGDFQKVLGLKWEEFIEFLNKCCTNIYGPRYYHSYMSDDEFEDLLESNEDLSELYDFIGSHQNLVVGDLLRVANYGLTLREGQPTIVILDSGCDDDVYNTHYRKR